MSSTLYYIVRKDLSHSQRAVQLVHAREAYAQAFEGYQDLNMPDGSVQMHMNGPPSKVKTAVVYVVKDEEALKRFLEEKVGTVEWVSAHGFMLRLGDAEWAHFREPDLNNQITAVCTNAGPFKLPLL